MCGIVSVEMVFQLLYGPVGLSIYSIVIHAAVGRLYAQFHRAHDL